MPVGLLEIRTNPDGSGYIAARDHATADAELWEREACKQVSRFMAVRAA